MSGSSKHDVYISYNSRDKEFVVPLVGKLRDKGVKVFVDQDLEPGDRWPELLPQALENSAVILICFGPSGLGRWQVDEAARWSARSSGQLVIPVLLPDSQSQDLPPFLSSLNWVDFRRGIDDEEQFQQLVQAIQRRTPSHPLMEEAPAPPLELPRNIPPSSPEEVSIFAASARDQPVKVDLLGFEPYVDAIAEFLVHEETSPPLTLSIEGEWGSGKSSFMLQLEEALKRRSGPECLTVWFNAWRHDKEDALWAAFASEFLRKIARQRSLYRRWLGHFRLFCGRYRWQDGWLEMLRAIAVWGAIFFLGVVVPVTAWVTRATWTREIDARLQALAQPQPPTAGSDEKKEEDPWLPVVRWLLGLGGLGAYTAGVLSLALKIKDVIGNPLDINLRKYLSTPDYEGRVSFIETFHEDFRKIVSAYADDQKVYVFIDDLDRCEVPKAAELMQALNLLIAEDPRLIFVIGMDREKVAAGLAVKHAALLPYLKPDRVDADGKIDSRVGLDYGFAFIEKFIQLPFQVPKPKPTNLEWFLSNLSRSSRAAITSGLQSSGSLIPPVTGATPAGASAPGDSGQVGGSQTPDRLERLKLVLRDDSATIREVALMVAPAIDFNPRRLKQFLNLFRLRAYICSLTGAFDEVNGSSLSLPQLAKFVAISLVWPGFIADLAERPGLLHDLYEVLFRQKSSDWQADRIQLLWLSESALMDLLRHGCEAHSRIPLDHSPYDLAHADLDRLLRVSPKVVRTPDPSPPPPPPSESRYGEGEPVVGSASELSARGASRIFGSSRRPAPKEGPL
jgi:hypothetical protein